MKDPWRFSCVTAGARHHQEGAGGQKRNKIGGIECRQE